MALKKHHKIMIGGFSSVVIIFMIVCGVFLYILAARQELNYRSLNKDIQELQTDTHVKINELTENIIQTKQTVSSLNTSIKTEINQLKASTDSDFSGIIEDAIKSVVTIKTEVGQGTGFLISENGYIVTNAHVLVGGSKVYAITYDKEVNNADFVGYNADLDIALLKISGNFDSIELSDSDNIQIGEKVIAIGNPLGLQFSVSEGIVSATDRAGANNLEAYIQTDAALNPGNSGGPLINKEGEVIGINNFKIGGGENLGFALESNFIKQSVNDISLEKIGEELI